MVGSWRQRMDNQRKEIIIKEIKYWKKSKLLPDHYCDFLLTLYTKGEHLNEDGKEKNHFIHFKAVMLFISIQALFLLAVLVIYFTDFSLLMQIAIVIFIAITMILITKKTRNELLYSLYAMMAAFVLFLLTVHFVLFFEHASSNGLLLAILGHSLAWFYIGWKWSIRFFVIAAILAIFVLLFILVR
jgi:hypothetical protein